MVLPEQEEGRTGSDEHGASGSPKGHVIVISRLR